MKLDFRNKKYLVTSGCSFTDGFNMGENASWPYYLSNLLNLELRNMARGGSGNEFISDSIIRCLENDDDVRKKCIVGIAWSDISRLMSSIKNNDELNLDTVQPQDFIEDGKYNYVSEASIFFSDISFCIYKTYLSIIKLTRYLESYDIPYFYIDAINKTKVDIIDSNFDAGMWRVYGHSNNIMDLNIAEFPHWYREILNKKINSSFFKNFIKIHNYDSILDFIFSDYDKYESGNPGHPNDIAAKEISQNIFEQIQ